MLKKETIGLLDKNNVDFRDIFSICAGKSFYIKLDLGNMWVNVINGIPN